MVKPPFDSLGAAKATRAERVKADALRQRNKFTEMRFGRNLGLLAGVLTLLLAACTRTPGPSAAGENPTNPSGDGVTDIWYVSNAADPGGADGSLASPFNKLEAAVAAADGDDVIYLFTGDGSSRNQAGGVTLKSGQQLIGQGVAFQNLAAGRAPLIGNARGPGIELARDNVIMGVRVEGSAGAGISGRNVGNLRLVGVEIKGNAREGLDLTVTGDSQAVVELRGITVSRNRGIGVQLVTSGAATTSFSLSGSTLEENLGNAVQLSYGGSGSGTFTISDNPSISSLGGSGVRVFMSGSADQRVRGRIERNTITASDPATAGNGVAVINEGDATAIVTVADNTVHDFGSYGIDVGSRGGAGVLEATVAGNTVADPAIFALAGMRLSAGNGTPGESSALCLDLRGNTTITGELPGYLQRQRPGTAFRLNGFAGRGSSVSSVESFVASRNVGSVSVSAAGTAYAGGSCRTPDL